MPTVSTVFKMKYGKNDGCVLSPSELVEQYFFGISLCDKATGRELDQSTIKAKLKIAQEQVEHFLSLKLPLSYHEENTDFIRDEYNNWGYIQCTFPIRDVFELTGFVGTVKQIEFPAAWLSIRKSTDETKSTRNLQIVPNGESTPNTNALLFTGITPHAGFWGLSSIPNYWQVSYCTGFLTPPADLVDAVGKLAAMQLFAILGDIVLGAGIAAQSLSFDGLSQNIQTTQSAENAAYSARIRQYASELKQQMPALRDYYTGILFTSM